MDEHTVKEDVLNILRVLSSSEGANQRALSGRLGFSLGKTNYLLNSLIKKGFIEIHNFTPLGNKLKKIHYILTPKGFEHKLRLAYYFLQKREEEYLMLKKEVGGMLCSGGKDVEWHAVQLEKERA